MRDIGYTTYLNERHSSFYRPRGMRPGYIETEVWISGISGTGKVVKKISACMMTFSTRDRCILNETNILCYKTSAVWHFQRESGGQLLSVPGRINK